MSGNKRPRFDDDGRSIRQLELELELARLRREETAQHQASVEREQPPAGEDDTEVSVVDAHPPQSGSTSTPSNGDRQQYHQTPSTGPSGPVTRGRGRSRGGNRGGNRGETRGLLTVMVCTTHDQIFCQICSKYESSAKYWERHNQ